MAAFIRSNTEETICLMAAPAVLWMLGSREEYRHRHRTRACRDGREETGSGEEGERKEDKACVGGGTHEHSQPANI